MFDLSKEFDEFYSDYTILPGDIQSDLRDKKKNKYRPFEIWY